MTFCRHLSSCFFLTKSYSLSWVFVWTLLLGPCSKKSHLFFHIYNLTGPKILLHQPLCSVPLIPSFPASWLSGCLPLKGISWKFLSFAFFLGFKVISARFNTLFLVWFIIFCGPLRIQTLLWVVHSGAALVDVLESWSSFPWLSILPRAAQIFLIFLP